jgi:rhamnopyranosyl-N-acetylglucosaminyl-diphospho-decaprenol beta-1,3/1,4-galactofuranosyltransferase
MGHANASRKPRIVAIVVTHNRRALLATCLQALLDQRLSCDVIIVDNASTDGTQASLRTQGLFHDDRVHYLRLDENSGGAGGFYHGLKYALSREWEWFWLMDDDAKPQPTALENLLLHASDSNTIYGSAPVGIENGKKRLCWTMTPVQRQQKTLIKYHEFLRDLEPVERLPFLGFFLHRNVIHLVGLPDPTFFIYHDDNDYCERARKLGVKFILVKSSIILHPLQKIHIRPFLGSNLRYRDMPPWKIYYDVRNAIRVARKHSPRSLWTKTMPSILLRFFCNAFTNRNTFLVLRAYALGIMHGFLNMGGKRFFPKRIRATVRD